MKNGTCVLCTVTVFHRHPVVIATDIYLITFRYKGVVAMKHRIIMVYLVLSFIAFQPLSASASLVVQDFGGTNVTIQTDPITNTSTYWYWDVNQFTDMTYQDVLDEIAVVNVPNLSATWNVASMAQVQNLVDDHAPGEIIASFSLTRVSYNPNTQIFDLAVNGRMEHYWNGARSQWESAVGSAGVYEDINNPLFFYADLVGGVTGSTFIGDTYTNDSIGAWVVSTDAQIVPIPPSLLLMASGLIGCVGLRRWVRR